MKKLNSNIYTYTYTFTYTHTHTYIYIYSSIVITEKWLHNHNADIYTINNYNAIHTT